MKIWFPLLSILIFTQQAHAIDYLGIATGFASINTSGYGEATPSKFYLGQKVTHDSGYMELGYSDGKFQHSTLANTYIDTQNIEVSYITSIGNRNIPDFLYLKLGINTWQSTSTTLGTAGAAVTGTALTYGLSAIFPVTKGLKTRIEYQAYPQSGVSPTYLTIGLDYLLKP